MVFENREDAGVKLAKELERRSVDADLVLAIPRGGLPVGRKIADALGIELDVVVASKIGAPKNPELGIGAAASDGSYWLNERMIEDLEVDQKFLEDGIKRESEKALEKLRYMRGNEKLPEIKEMNVLIVDDGIATGGTAIACIRQVKNAGANKIILVVPVAPLEGSKKLEDEVDELIILEIPDFFSSVGSHYKYFNQVSDAEARKYLE